MATSTRGPAEQPPPQAPPDCPRCGSATAPQQEYCLECGARLPAVEPASGGSTRRLRGGARESLLTIVVAFVVAAVAAAAVVAVQLTGNDAEQPFLTATAPQQAAPEPEPIETALPPGEEEPVEAEPPADEEPGPEPEPPAQPPQLIGWPSGTDGWTVILASIPTGSGRAAATARARQARDAGLPEVGVLVSANFASLHPGYLNVFSGVYATQGEAEAAVPAVRAAGYPDAYPRRITP